MKYSILVPTYKSEYLTQCIDSVLSQTFDDWELVVVNDDSPFDIDSIMAIYEDQRISYYKNETNYGLLRLVENWNHCLEYAKGEYVMCIGDDDMLLPNCLEDYNMLIDKYPGKNVYHTRMLIIDENSDITEMREDRPGIESVYSMIWHFLNGGRSQRIGDWLFRTSHLKEKGGFINFPCAWGSDDITAFTMAIETGVANLHVPGFLYRNHSQTITNKSSVGFDKMEAWVQIEDWHHQFLLLEPQDKMDQLYAREIRKKLPSWLYVRKLYDLCEDINARKRNVFKWWKNRKHYRLSKKMIIVAFVLAIKKSIF